MSRKVSIDLQSAKYQKNLNIDLYLHLSSWLSILNVSCSTKISKQGSEARILLLDKNDQKLTDGNTESSKADLKA
jgi:hypothetical protein